MQNAKKCLTISIACTAIAIFMKDMEFSDVRHIVINNTLEDNK